MGKRMTKPQRKLMGKLEKWVRAQIDLIYLAGRPNDLPFSECYARAPQEHKAAYDEARRALADFEHKMADEGRGWFDNGRFRDYGDPYGLHSYAE